MALSGVTVLSTFVFMLHPFSLLSMPGSALTLPFFFVHDSMETSILINDSRSSNPVHGIHVCLAWCMHKLTYYTYRVCNIGTSVRQVNQPSD